MYRPGIVEFFGEMPADWSPELISILIDKTESFGERDAHIPIERSGSFTRLHISKIKNVHEAVAMERTQGFRWA